MTTHHLPDGRKLTFRQEGEGPVIVLLHGWAMSSAVFSEIMTLLAADFRVLAPDLRGHGYSDEGSGYALVDFAEDLRDWLATFERPVDLFGWSLGGQVAMRVQQLEPAFVNRLGLISSTPRFVSTPEWSSGLPQGQVLAMLRQLKRHYRQAMNDFFDLQFAGEDLSPRRYREVVDFAVRQGRLPDPDVAESTLKTLYRGNLCPELSHIQCPTYVMHGERDMICPAGAGRALAGKIPHARLEMLSGIGHAPFLSDPEKVAHHWRVFLQ